MQRFEQRWPVTHHVQSNVDVHVVDVLPTLCKCKPRAQMLVALEQQLVRKCDCCFLRQSGGRQLPRMLRVVGVLEDVHHQGSFIPLSIDRVEFMETDRGRMHVVHCGLFVFARACRTFTLHEPAKVCHDGAGMKSALGASADLDLIFDRLEQL